MDSKWMEFLKHPSSSGKTDECAVIAKGSGDLLGRIKWYPSWRHYCFFPNMSNQTVFSDRCLVDLSNMVTRLNNEHAEALRSRKQQKPGKRTCVVDVSKQDCDVYAGRKVLGRFATDSPLANPFPMKEFGERCLVMHRVYLRTLLKRKEVGWSNLVEHERVAIYRALSRFVARWGQNAIDLKQLVGKRIGCWCVNTDQLEPLVCHVQNILAEMVEDGLI